MILHAVFAHLLPCSWSLAPYYTEQQQALRRRVEHAFVRGWQVRPNGHVPVFLDAQRLYIRDGAGSYVQVPVGTGRALSGRDMYRWVWRNRRATACGCTLISLLRFFSTRTVGADGPCGHAGTLLRADILAAPELPHTKLVGVAQLFTPHRSWCPGGTSSSTLQSL